VLDFVAEEQIAVKWMVWVGKITHCCTSTAQLMLLIVKILNQPQPQPTNPQNSPKNPNKKIPKPPSSKKANQFLTFLLTRSTCPSTKL
jgi:hypothetical protein